MNVKRKRVGTAADYIIALVCVVIIFVTAYPFWNLAVISLNDAVDGMRGGLTFWPRKFTFQSYKAVLLDSTNNLGHAAMISVYRTVLGTILNVFVTSLAAFLMSRPKFILHAFLQKYIVVSMYLGAGLIPTYLLYMRLGLLNSFWVYIVPHLFSASNSILVLAYIRSIPHALSEAAYIDGANEIQVYLRIILPLIKPSLACITLFIAVWQWGQWQDTFFFAAWNKEISTLQYEMMKGISTATQSVSEQTMREGSATTTSSESLQAAMTMIATVPILAVYPFLQKYFIKGLTIGSVKG